MTRLCSASTIRPVFLNGEPPKILREKKREKESKRKIHSKDMQKDVYADKCWPRAMMPPGWKKEWHRGVRASQSRKLVGFIAAIPVELRVRDKVLHASEVNFLCIHKKLRSKRLAPVLIKEITRLCNLEGVFQAIYTGGIVLPKPVSTCRYYHRAINWQKLYDVGFSPLPPNSKPQFQIRKYAVPDRTSIRGLREMQKKDIAAVQTLLTRYLAKYDLAAEFDKQEVEHWLLHNKKDALEEQVVWTYVVEVSLFYEAFALLIRVLTRTIG